MKQKKQGDVLLASLAKSEFQFKIHSAMECEICILYSAKKLTAHIHA